MAFGAREPIQKFNISCERNCKYSATTSSSNSNSNTGLPVLIEEQQHSQKQRYQRRQLCGCSHCCHHYCHCCCYCQVCCYQYSDCFFVSLQLLILLILRHFPTNGFMQVHSLHSSRFPFMCQSGSHMLLSGVRPTAADLKATASAADPLSKVVGFMGGRCHAGSVHRSLRVAHPPFCASSSLFPSRVRLCCTHELNVLQQADAAKLRTKLDTASEA